MLLLLVLLTWFWLLLLVHLHDTCTCSGSTYHEANLKNDFDLAQMYMDMLMLVHTAYDVRMIIMIYFDVYADDYDLVTFTFCTELFAVFRIHSWGLGLCRDTP